MTTLSRSSGTVSSLPDPGYGHGINIDPVLQRTGTEVAGPCPRLPQDVEAVVQKMDAFWQAHSLGGFRLPVPNRSRWRSGLFRMRGPAGYRPWCLCIRYRVLTGSSRTSGLPGYGCGGAVLFFRGRTVHLCDHAPTRI